MIRELYDRYLYIVIFSLFKTFLYANCVYYQYLLHTSQLILTKCILYNNVLNNFKYKQIAYCTFLYELEKYYLLIIVHYFIA